MAYHETFWVVAGTAAPVIALAQIVALPDLLKTLVNRTEWLGSYMALAIAGASNVAAQAVLLLVSLSSLARTRNTLSPNIAESLAVIGLAYLAIGVVFPTLVRVWDSWHNANEKQSQDSSGGDDDQPATAANQP